MRQTDLAGQAGDKSACGELGITREMTQAATEVLWASGAVAYEANGADQVVVDRMLKAALLAKPSQRIGLNRNKRDATSG
jgi:hypothetical protein